MVVFSCTSKSVGEREAERGFLCIYYLLPVNQNEKIRHQFSEQEADMLMLLRVFIKSIYTETLLRKDFIIPEINYELESLNVHSKLKHFCCTLILR